MPRAVSHTIGIPGIEVAVWYNENNLRITEVTWTISVGFVARCQIWDNGSQIYDRTYGSGSGAENVPGNFRMVIDPEFGGYILPTNITYQINLQSIG